VQRFFKPIYLLKSGGGRILEWAGTCWTSFISELHLTAPNWQCGLQWCWLLIMSLYLISHFWGKSSSLLSPDGIFKTKMHQIRFRLGLFSRYLLLCWQLKNICACFMLKLCYYRCLIVYLSSVTVKSYKEIIWQVLSLFTTTSGWMTSHISSHGMDCSVLLQ